MVFQSRMSWKSFKLLETLVPYHRGNFFTFLYFLHVVQMLIGLGMNPQTSFGFAGIVAHLTPVRFISTGVGFTIRQTRMLLTFDAIDASHTIVRMLFLHMDFQLIFIFVMQIALGTFEGFADGCWVTFDIVR